MHVTNSNVCDLYLQAGNADISANLIAVKSTCIPDQHESHIVLTSVALVVECAKELTFTSR